MDENKRQVAIMERLYILKMGIPQLSHNHVFYCVNRSSRYNAKLLSSWQLSNV